ncbi:hypothetical protein FA15DRAFT_582618 [Coprinopsis marcescibilis]|uniref:Sodium/calcium exchanger membrane region domain-containing protein n=1 Tax=Coprinopsis marcescibilis TaxID=230819 RepID=A0A5C3L901_COPMA|nr:hypothetical protein FA15DRAFT_582618 [Coprinopsis marcescibilis]
MAEKVRFWERFTRKGKENVGVRQSLVAIVRSSYLNILLILIPISWVSRFMYWPSTVTFSLSFIAILPLAKLFEFGAEEMHHYLGHDFGDLLSVTLHNAVEATLAIILLLHCDLALLKSTVIGVVLLHLLLVPGMSFIAGGARVATQDLHPHVTELNRSLLAVGSLSLMVPSAFYAALDDIEIDDELRDNFLSISRGIAFCLLFVYVCSRIYLHYPPGDEVTPVPQNKKVEDHGKHSEPRVNQYVCVGALLVCIGLMAVTAEWLVNALDDVKEDVNIQLGWFGLILLPMVSYAAHGAVAVGYSIRKAVRVALKLAEPKPPTTFAKGKPIDLSIQFTLFWLPFLVLLSWIIGKPLTLLFDFFEVSVLLGACFIVNYVTADAKTNWAEGAALVSFYVMIIVAAWYYPGSKDSEILSSCNKVSESLQQLAQMKLL